MPNSENLTPQHVAIIMDGNGRWAKERGLPRKLGHKKGAETLKNLLENGRNLGIKFLTVYAFSAENWQRPASEVTALMTLLGSYLQKEAKLLKDNKIRLRTIGDLSTLEPKLRDNIESLVEETQAFDEFHFTLALSYGSKQEIIRAAQKCVTDGLNEITEEALTARLDSHDIPDPDLLIRTGGDQRLSNFLLWQSAYTELYFTESYWPDFTIDHLTKALQCFETRERRFGRVG